ncbi:hypothetical protein Glove_202g17 [Diversispora epigaea]|uniref:Uncharacterized protein n=1 Tax=Diversispora epigaea TaxID=1348612 RepID=A0A397IPM5_9GLOM|nr:hypothetical protein Glove_202g17 [Diversispora epigaea]
MDCGKLIIKNVKKCPYFASIQNAYILHNKDHSSSLRRALANDSREGECKTNNWYNCWVVERSANRRFFLSLFFAVSPNWKSYD